jgi:hypothetical protein
MSFIKQKWWSNCKVHNFVKVDQRFTIRDVSDEQRISCGSCQAISTKDFGIRHVSEVCPTAAESWVKEVPVCSLWLAQTFRNKFVSKHCNWWWRGFGGLGVACWPLVPKFVGSNPAETVGFLRAKKILSTPSFGGEVKPAVPCRRFSAC